MHAFQLRCPTNTPAAPIWSFDIGTKQLAAPISVSANCPVQFLDIVASGGKGQLGMEATIAGVAITQE